MTANVSHDKVISHLYSLIDTPPSEPLYTITLHDLLTAIALRMGQDALSLTATDLQLAREEVLAVLQHRMDHRPYLDEALDIWQITRQL